MPSYDDDDNVSGDSGSEENDIDENMEDADDAENDGDGDGDVDMDDEGDADDNEDNEGDEEGDEAEDEDQDENDENDEQEQPDTPSRPRPQHRSPGKSAATPLPNGLAIHVDKDATERARKTTSASLSPRTVSGRGLPVPLRPSYRPETITASTYDIVPTIAAPQSTSINAITALPDMRWVFTGGTDGYIRKYNWIDTVNGKQLLTVAQRHPFVDSVVKAGVLLSYWENADSTIRTPVKDFEAPPVSPVYSLVVERSAIWIVSGDETGSLTMQTVRHKEGNKIVTLRKHTSAVSVLVLAPDEQSVLSGSWDKQIHDIDLNNGNTKRTYAGSASQISAIEPRPQSSVPVPQDIGEPHNSSGLFSSNNTDKPRSSGALLNNNEGEKKAGGTEGNENSGAASPFDDMDSLFGDDDAGALAPGIGDDEDDEFSRAIASAPQQQAQADEENPSDIPLDPDFKPPAEDTPMEVDGETQPAGDPAINGAEASQTTTIPDTQLTQPTPSPNPQSDSPATISNGLSTAPTDDTAPSSETTFLDASISGTLRIWDRRMPNPIAQITPRMGTPPWCMSACWSPDGNYIYAGRRNNSVDEYSLHKSVREPVRTLRFPGSSKAVSAVKPMPNGRHLVCASHDILRLYDLQSDAVQGKHAVVPFLIIPGHRTGVISHLFLDPTCRFMISTAGNRGWEGQTTEVLLGYEIGVPPA